MEKNLLLMDITDCGATIDITFQPLQEDFEFGKADKILLERALNEAIAQQDKDSRHPYRISAYLEAPQGRKEAYALRTSVSSDYKPAIEKAILALKANYVVTEREHSAEGRTNSGGGRGR